MVIPVRARSTTAEILIHFSSTLRAAITHGISFMLNIVAIIYKANTGISNQGTGRRYQLDNITGPGGAAKGNPQYEFLGVTRYWRYSRERMEELYREGRIVQPSPGAIPRYKRYLDEMKGQPLQALWTDIDPINSQAKERLGYATQKPEALLERIISTSSNEGDIVLDPFCGCGTAIAVAERLKRGWIGIDITFLAISLIETRLQNTFKGDLSPYEVIGDPKDVFGARALAEKDRYQFEWWAVGKVGAYPAQDKRKGADSGIDGVIKFFDDNSGKPKKIIIQVKSGKPQLKEMRDFIHVVDREKAVIGAYVTLIRHRANAERSHQRRVLHGRAFYGQYYPRIQILTIEAILQGASIQYPRGADATFKKAERKYKEPVPEQENLY